MKDLKEWFAGLSPMMQVVVIIIILLLLWYILQYIKSFLSTYSNKIAQKSEVDALHAAGVKQTYPNSWYKVSADALETAMDGWFTGTNDAVVFTIFNDLRNDIDYILTDQAFGMRDNATMVEWLKGDMSTAEIATLNSNMLSKGMTKQI